MKNKPKYASKNNIVKKEGYLHWSILEHLIFDGITFMKQKSAIRFLKREGKVTKEFRIL